MRAMVFLLLFGLAGCASQRVQNEVTSFHLWPADVSGKTFFVLPFKKEDVASIEFATYATLVTEKLRGLGMQRVQRADELPEFVVWLGYGRDDGKVLTRSVPLLDVQGGTTSFSGAYAGQKFSGTATKPTTLHVAGAAQYSQVVYERMLVLGIERRSLRQPTQLRPVYQARVRSDGRSAEMAQVVPAMIDALFRDFPGTSGRTTHVATQLR